jgi:hypothetical protein
LRTDSLNHVLEYFEKQQKSKMQDTLYLREDPELEVLLVPDYGRDNVFCVKTSEKQLFMSTSSQREMHKWVQALADALHVTAKVKDRKLATSPRETEVVPTSDGSEMNMYLCMTYGQIDVKRDSKTTQHGKQSRKSLPIDCFRSSSVTKCSLQCSCPSDVPEHVLLGSELLSPPYSRFQTRSSMPASKSTPGPEQSFQTAFDTSGLTKFSQLKEKLEQWHIDPRQVQFVKK